MGNKLAGWLFIYILLVILTAAAEMTSPDSTLLGKIIELSQGIDVGSSTNALGYIIAYIEFGGGWLDIITNVMFSIPSFYSGWYMIFWILIWLPISISIVYGMVAMLRGASA